MSHRSTRLSIFLTGVVIIGAACSETSTPENTSAANLVTSTTIASERSSDGALHLGLLVPLTDPMATFGPELVPIVETMVRIMNDQGGFQGRTIELTVRDEGKDPETAEASARALVEQDGVDAVIGPFSSTNAPSALPILVNNGVAACSPSASSLMLDAYDDQGLFLRTVTSDSAIARKMVDLAENTGQQSITLLYPDDLYGRIMAQTIRSSVEERQDLEIRMEIPYSSTSSDASEVLDEVKADASLVQMLIGSPAVGSDLLNEIARNSQVKYIFTNDTFFNTEITALKEPSNEEVPLVVGVARDVFFKQDVLELLQPNSPGILGVESGSLPAFTSNTIDCAMVLWLAALSSQSDDARRFKDEFNSVTNEGQQCWFVQCSLSVKANTNFDYEGAANLELDENGDALDRGLILYQFFDGGVARNVGPA